MDVDTLEAIVSFLTLLVLAFGGLLGTLWRSLAETKRDLAKHQTHVAECYVKTPELDQRLNHSIEAVMSILTRLEYKVNELSESRSRSIA